MYNHDNVMLFNVYYVWAQTNLLLTRILESCTSIYMVFTCVIGMYVCMIYLFMDCDMSVLMLNKNTQDAKKSEANQKQQLSVKCALTSENCDSLL